MSDLATEGVGYLDIRETAQAKAEELFPERIMHFHGGATTDLSDPWRSAFVGGAVWAVDQLPDKAELELAILGRTANRAADAVLALIRDRLGTPGEAPK